MSQLTTAKRKGDLDSVKRSRSWSRDRPWVIQKRNDTLPYPFRNLRRRRPGKAIRFGAVVAPASRPRALPCLFSSKEPPKPSGGMDIMDSLTGNERGMSTEEKIAALQREVQAQVRDCLRELYGFKSLWLTPWTASIEGGS